jgi:UBX domain-containing protein 6
MADLIKKLIDKKRRDAKFKSAGPGHKLNEEKPKTQTVPSTSSQRYEPCAEARQAGMAALARCSTSNSHAIPGFSM